MRRCVSDQLPGARKQPSGRGWLIPRSALDATLPTDDATDLPGLDDLWKRYRRRRRIGA